MTKGRTFLVLCSLRVLQRALKVGVKGFIVYYMVTKDPIENGLHRAIVQTDRRIRSSIFPQNGFKVLSVVDTNLPSINIQMEELMSYGEVIVEGDMSYAGLRNDIPLNEEVLDAARSLADIDENSQVE